MNDFTKDSDLLIMHIMLIIWWYLTKYLLLLQYFTGLECGHKFCMQCWGDYLTTKIIEEGMGQVPINISVISHCRPLNYRLTNESASVCPQTISCPAHSCDILVDDNTVMWVSASTCFYFFDGSSHWLALSKRRAWPVFAVWLTSWRRQEEFLTYCKRQNVAMIVAGCCEASVHHTGILSVVLYRGSI